MFMGVEASYTVLLINYFDDSVLKLESSSIFLKNDQTNATVLIDLSTKLPNYYSDLIVLINSICYFNELEVKTVCFPKNDPSFVTEADSAKRYQVHIEPNGLFKFNVNATQLKVYNFNNNLNGNNRIEIQVDRLFGSKTKARLFFTLTSLDPLIDMVFDSFMNMTVDSLSSFIQFDKNAYSKKLDLKLSSKFFLLSEKRFFIYLTNLQIINDEQMNASTFANFETDKILAVDFRADISVNPDDSSADSEEVLANLKNIVAFPQNYIMIPVFSDTPTKINVSFDIYRIGMDSLFNSNTSINKNSYK
jgi:hypothetical protein